MNITTSGNLGYGSYPSVQFKDNLHGQGRVKDFVKKHGKKIGIALGSIALGTLASHLGVREQGIAGAPVRDLYAGPKQRVMPPKVQKSLDRMDATVARHKRMAGRGKKRGRPRKK